MEETDDHIEREAEADDGAAPCDDGVRRVSGDRQHLADHTGHDAGTRPDGRDEE